VEEEKGGKNEEKGGRRLDLEKCIAQRCVIGGFHKSDNPEKGRKKALPQELFSIYYSSGRWLSGGNNDHSQWGGKKRGGKGKQK